MLWFN